MSADELATLFALPDPGDVLGLRDRAILETLYSCALRRSELMSDNGADIRFIQQLLGHARVDTTQIYTEVSIGAVQEVHARTHPHGRS